MNPRASAPGRKVRQELVPGVFTIFGDHQWGSQALQLDEGSIHGHPMTLALDR